MFIGKSFSWCVTVGFLKFGFSGLLCVAVCCGQLRGWVCVGLALTAYSPLSRHICKYFGRCFGFWAWNGRIVCL